MAEREFTPDPNKFVGKLPDWKIREYIGCDRIKIVPKPETDELEELLGPVSLDFRLGTTIRYLDTQGMAYIDFKDPDLSSKWKTHDLRTSKGLYILHQRHFVQAETFEWLELPDDIVGHLNGKSSLSRYGLLVHATAPRFDPGWKGRVVLELRNVSELAFPLEENMQIAAMEFEEMMSPAERPYTKRPNPKFSFQQGA